MAYDSRTDAPRTRHNHYYCRDATTAPVQRQTEKQAIAEGLTEYYDSLPLPGACGVCGAVGDPACVTNC